MSAPPSYLMGHTDHERRRLGLQAEILNPLTEEFFVRAGVSQGMRILDLGCGIGDVALIAARLAGPRGQVVAVDMDGDALKIAQTRAADAGLEQIRFEQAKVAEYHAREPYDAVVGRHILIHTPDPLAILRHVTTQVRPGGIVAFEEYDLSRFYPNTPAKPLYEKTFQLFVDFFTRVTHADIGLRLLQLFRDVGLQNVQSRAEFMLDGGPDCLYYEWVAETVRSIIPKLEALGIATAKEIDVDTLAERLKAEALSVGGYLATPVVVGTFGYRQ